jgi:hypothetical protein
MRVFLLAVSVVAASAQTVDFVKQVEPIFAAKCYGCHGPKQQLAGLRLDVRSEALSKVVARVSGAPGMKAMPMGTSGLPAGEVALIKTWIDQGAAYPQRTVKAGTKHWAYQAVRKPQAPANAIDHLIRERLTREGLAPSKPASRETLLRRVSLDLTGLPPSPADLADGDYERHVDRLLASPQFGEKWARHWLDQARYADSDGYEKDWARPWSWRWRHWVIEAINRDMPFDQFTREQIAGDLLPNATVEQRVATGFHRHTLTNREGGIDNAQFRFENVADRSSTVGSVWLGLTVGCAQCHDHKYDPLTQRDFYQFYAFFDNAEEDDIDAPLPGELGVWSRTAAEFEAMREALIAAYKVREMQPAWEVDMLDAFRNPGRRTDWDLAWDCLLKLTEDGDGGKIIKKPAADRTARERRILENHFIRNYHFAVGQKRYKEVKFDELDKKLGELQTQYPRISQAYALTENAVAAPSHLRVRGDFKILGPEVQPLPPGFLPPLASRGARATRLDLADWLVAKDNPLTARVAVNRIWQELFGQGLVKTAEDFGVMGSRPSHPELLDWLAATFVENGWSRKKLIREIVMSETYRQSSEATAAQVEKDPENKWLARQSRVRIPAEGIRDAALHAAGLLDLSRVGGPSIKPPQPEGVTSIGYARGTKWELSSGVDRYRRGLYIHFQRTTPYPLLMNFDAPRSTTAACRRQRSNTSLQALNLLNDPVFLEAAETLALRVLREGPADNRGRIETMSRLAIGRAPSAAEMTRLANYLDTQRTLFAKEKDLPVAAVPNVDRVEHAAWAGLASVFLNLDEFLTRE